jgi:hypothetical protein
MGKCWSCGDPVAFVRPRGWGQKKLLLDPTPREFAQWLVLPDGVRALPVTNEDVQRILKNDVNHELGEWPRFAAHSAVCRVAGVQRLGYTARNATGSQRQSEWREEKRRRILEIERLRDIEVISD